jgi:hypothetical protein
MAALVAVWAVFLQPGGRRGLAIVLVVVAFAAGAAAARRLPPRRPDRTPMERLNDIAFLLVASLASLLVGLVAHPWGAIVPALVAGVVAGAPFRPAGAPRGEEPGA